MIDKNLLFLFRSSDRDESDEFLWPSLPTSPHDKGNENVFFGPDTLEQSIQRKEENRAKTKREDSIPNDYSTTIPPPTYTLEAPPHDTLKSDESQHQKNNDLDRQRLLKKAIDDFADSDDDSDDEELSKKSNSKTKDSKGKKFQSAKDMDQCPETPPNLTGKIKLDTSEDSIDDVQKKLGEMLYTGGYYAPPKCQARHSVAIIVPYRNRPKDLAIFLKNIHPFLQKQQLEYGIFVIEQTVGTKFNRGMLLNVGYLEAKKIKKWDCYIFHDVDLLPMDDRILYRCSENPRHLAVAVDKFDNV